MIKKRSGLGARMAAKPLDAVAAGMEAALGVGAPFTSSISEDVKDVVAINVRLPRSLHRSIRKAAFDREKSMNALIVEAAEAMFGRPE